MNWPRKEAPWQPCRHPGNLPCWGQASEVYLQDSHQIITHITTTFKISLHRAVSRFTPSQWETSLQSNAISHWLGANLESGASNHFSCRMEDFGCGTDGKWASCCPKSPATWLFIQQFLEANIKETPNLHVIGPFMDSPHKGPVTWQMFPCNIVPAKTRHGEPEISVVGVMQSFVFLGIWRFLKTKLE